MINSYIVISWFCMYQKCKRASKASNHFPAGTCGRGALLDGLINVTEGNTKYQVKAYRTYDVNTRLYFDCNDGFWRDGPEVVTCTASGVWTPFNPTFCRSLNSGKKLTNYYH